jgi:hypothetical protein
MLRGDGWIQTVAPADFLGVPRPMVALVEFLFLELDNCRDNDNNGV